MEYFAESTHEKCQRLLLRPTERIQQRTTEETLWRDLGTFSKLLGF